MGEYRVVFIPAIEKTCAEVFTQKAESIDEAHEILNAIARYTLYLHDKKLMIDYSNLGVIEQFVDGEWQEADE